MSHTHKVASLTAPTLLILCREEEGGSMCWVLHGPGIYAIPHATKALKYIYMFSIPTPHPNKELLEGWANINNNKNTTMY